MVRESKIIIGSHIIILSIPCWLKYATILHNFVVTSLTQNKDEKILNHSIIFLQGDWLIH